jgi:hypothetical protein
MAQQKESEEEAIENVLRLVDQLSPDAREEVLHRLKVDDLRREIQKGLDSAQRGEVYSEEEALVQLEEHRQKVIKRQNK